MVRTGKEQVVIKRGSWTWRVRPELAGRVDELARAVLSGKRRGRARQLKETGGRRSIWEMEIAEAGIDRAFVKHYSKPKFVKQLKHTYRNSRTRQEWAMGLALESLGLPVARHLAMAERRRGGLLMEDYLIQEELVGYRNFDDWFREQWEPVTSGPGVKDRRQAVEGLADLIRFMHDRGALQRDFKPDSIMVGPEGDLKLVDLERALVNPFGLKISRGVRVANLAKIDQTFGFIGTMTDRIRFLKRYFKDDKLGSHKLRDMMEDIGRGAEIEWRKRAREVRVWARERNESYEQYKVDGYRVTSHFCIHRPFIESVIEGGCDAGCEDHACVWSDGQRPHNLYARWGDALTALENTVSLYYRKPPFVPARSAIYPGDGRFGLILRVSPDPALETWVEAAKRSRQEGTQIEFAEDLGRTLRVLHRMGITSRAFLSDTMLYDREAASWTCRFYINRVEDLLMDRTPSMKEGRERLARIGELLELDAASRERMSQAYIRGLARWFPYLACPWDY